MNRRAFLGALCAVPLGPLVPQLLAPARPVSVEHFCAMQLLVERGERRVPWFVFDEVAAIEASKEWADNDYIVQTARMPENF
jgi:hypothetical protein